LGRSRRRKRRWFAIIGLAVLLLLAGAYSYLRVEWEGADLGDNLASILNKRMRGRISIGSIEWPVSALKKAVTGGWAPIIVRNVRVWDDCALSSDLSDVDERRLGDPSEDCTPDDRPDPDPNSKRKARKLLLDAPLITAEIDVHAAMFGNHDLVFRHAVVHGGELLLEQTEEPYPLHAYDRTNVSFLTAFQSRMKAGFRAGIYASEPPPKFDLYDAHVKDLNVTIQFAPYNADGGKVGYGLAARIEGVEIDAGSIDQPLSKTDGPELVVKTPTTYLHMNAEDPLVPKFYVRLALAGKHTRMRILDEGKREAFVIPGAQQLGGEWAKGRSARYEFELSQIDINRIAQLPDQWGRKDYVANNLELDISAHTIPCKTAGVAGNPADGADVRIRGELRNWWDRPYDGEWNLDLDIKNAGPTVRTCVKDNIGGDDLHGQIRLRGPFIASPRIELDLHNLDFDVPLSKKEEPIRLTLKEVDGYIDMVNEQGSINRTTALIRGGKEPGEVQLSARFGLKPLLAVADLDIVKPIDIGRFLPPRAVSSVGKFLAGKLTVGGDVDEGFELKNFDLSLGRTQNERDKSFHVFRGRIFAKNEFEWTSVENVQFEAGQSRASINGAIEYKDDEFAYRSMKIRGEFPDLSSWLVRFGIPPIVQSASSGEIMLDGPLTNPTITVRSKLKGIFALGSVTPTTTTTTTAPAPPTQTQATGTPASIPCLAEVDLENAVIKDKIVDARLSTASLGGNVRGTIRVDLSGTRPVIQKLDFAGSRVDLGKLCGIRGLVKGNLDSFRLVIDKPTVIDKNRAVVDWLGAMKVQLSAPKLNVLGETYSNVTLSLNQRLKDLPAWLSRRLDADDEKQCSEAQLRGGFCAVVEATRDLGGKLGAVVADVPSSKAGRVMINRRLGGTLAIDDIPLAVLDPIIGTGALGGLVSATLHFGGDANAPSVEIGSTINLTRAWFRDAYVGDAQLGIIPTTFGGGDAVRIYGNVMAGQIGIDAIVGTIAPFPVDLALSGRRVEVDHFIDLTKKLGFTEPLQAWASGTVTVRTELKPLSGKPSVPEAWVELTEVEAIVNQRSAEGRQQPLRFAMVPRAQGQFALSARVTRDTIDLACRNYAAQGGQTPCPAQLNTPAGVVTLAGGATATQMKLHAQGELDLSRLAPLLENQVEDIDGLLSLEGQVTGTFTQPRYEVALDVKNIVSLRLPGGEAVLQILGPRVVDGEQVPGAQIKIANGVVGLSSFVVNVRDERKDEQGELQVSGSLGLDDSFKPASWGVLVEGQVAGKMLSAIAPGAISQASGLARIDAALGGKGALPLVNATVTFDPIEGTRAQPLEIVPRGVRRALTFAGGSVEILTTKSLGDHRVYTLDFRDNPLAVTIDNEGKLNDIRGQIVLGDGKLDRAYVSLDADNVPYRVPGQFEVLMSARDLRLELPSANAVWAARGSIAIVSGTFKRNFVLTEAIRPAPDRVSPAKPLWDEYPSIGNADLDVAIEVRKFAVENNLGPPGAPAIELAGPRLLLTGSPREPRLAGTIRVLRGEFRIPATRARFTRTGGTIDFAENEKASNPALDIQSDADYFDLSGQAHTITMNITGTLEAPQWDLHTSTGYNKSQTLALLFLGRSPEQLSRTLGDQSLGANPTNVDPSTNPTTGFADQIVKDLAGDWVSGLIGSSLSRITGLDVLRFEIGFGTVGIHAEKKAIENIRLIGDAEQTTRGYTLNARAEVKTPPVAPYVLPMWLNPWRTFTRDRTTLQGAVLKKEFNDPAEIDITDFQAKAVYRLFIP
jgi:hypothetical protein